MGDATSIEWTDATWNPIRGCSRVSAGCENCYAERVAARFSGPGQPYQGLAKMTKSGPRWTRKVRLVPEHLADPLRWQRPRRIFVNSMSDIFHEELSNWQIAAVFGVMSAAPHHTFQVLTKRAKRMREWFAWLEELIEPMADRMSGADCAISIHEARERVSVEECIERAQGELEDAKLCSLSSFGKLGAAPRCWPLANVWLGVSTEDQEAAEARIPELLRTPAAVRFISAEPLIGELDLGLRGIDWVIAGCESGPGARACSTEWLRNLRDQCADAGTAFFLKQGPASLGLIELGRGSHAKGRGKIIAAPYLDGVQHIAFPEISHE